MSKGTSSRSQGFTTAHGKTMEVMSDPHFPGGKRLVPTLTDAESNPLVIRRKSKDVLNGPVRRTTEEPADLDRSVGNALEDAVSLLRLMREYPLLEKVRREQLRRADDGVPRASALSNLGSLLQDMGRLQDAEPLLRESLDMRRTMLGPEHPKVKESLESLRTLLQEMGRLEDAEALTAA